MLAHLPGSDSEVLDAVLGGRVLWCRGMETFLGELEAAPRAVTLLRTGGDGDPPDELIRRIARHPHCGVLFLTSERNSVEIVLAAEGAGAAGVLPHPPSAEDLGRELRPILDEGPELAVPSDPPEAPPVSPGEERIVGSSPELIEVYRLVGRVAASSAPVLITGESGTGKELVARALHFRGARRTAPFIPVNCAAIPDTLLESELFGHEKGAFTGAVGRSIGRFGRADGGTLFLDEIGEMSLSLQAKLLRVLETGEVERLGSGEVVRVNVRVVAATNRTLRDEVASGRFREDLLFRLGVVEVALPPLRNREGDLVPLTLHFVQSFAVRYGRPIRGISREAMRRIESHSWPGNVRELRNVLDRAVLMSRGGVIRSGDLKLGDSAPRVSPVDSGTPEGFSPSLTLKEVEALHIRRVLEHTGGHMGEAAELLGIHRNTMTVKVREYGIEVGETGGKP